MVPRVKGGRDVGENRQLLCGHCNKVKGGWPGMDELDVEMRER